jgi:hypothetical protein
MCGWRVRAAETGHALVIPQERYDGVALRMVRAVKFADASRPYDAEAFRQASDALAYGPDFAAPSMSDLPEDILRPQTREEFWGAFRLQVTMATDAELPELLRIAFARFLKELPDASLWYVALDARAAWRAAVIRALFTASVAPEALTRKEAEFAGFPPGGSLMQSLLVGLSAYIEPPLMIDAPWLIGMNGARRAGSVVVLFGRSEPGFVGRQHPELISALRPHGLVSGPISTQRPSIPATSSEAFLLFWVDRLNALVSRALDPTEFVDAHGKHKAGEHFAAIASIESTFVSLQSLLSNAGRDSYVRQMSMFSMLDQLEGMRFDNWMRMVTPTKARRAFAALEAELPSDVASVALWRVRPAVDELENLKKGDCAA